MKIKQNYFKLFKRLKKSSKKIIESSYSLDDVIVKQIKEGINFGYEPRYYIYSNIYYPSIESEYISYHNKPNSDGVYEEIFEKMTSEILPYRLGKYKIEVLNDEAGKYFEVKLI